MSFSNDVKNELARIDAAKACCTLAEIGGFVKACGVISPLGGDKLRLTMHTENSAVVRHYKTLFKEYFDVDPDVAVIKTNALNRQRRFSLILDDNKDQKAEIILRELGILIYNKGISRISDDINEQLIKTKCCRKAYMRGAFLGAGTMSDPDKAYHIEFICNNDATAQAVKKLLNSFIDISAKKFERNDKHVVYIKEAEQVGDILNLLGAHQQFFVFQDKRMTKEMRNVTNRISNCDSANTDRIVDAAQNQIAAIRKIEEVKGLECLPEKLREVAELRLENPYAGLSELALMLEPNLSKSGLNNRIKKILKIADEI